MAAPLSEACCSTGTPQFGNYRGKGVVKQIADFRTYEVGSGSKVVIVAYDIFGLDMPTTLNFIDRLVEGSGNDLRIIMPDYFKGKPFPTENFPPSDYKELFKFVNERGNWDIVKEVTEATLEHYKIQEFSILGFCWGGKQVVRYAADGRCRAAVSVHGSRLEASDAEGVVSPLFIINAKDDSPFEPLKAVLDQKPVGSRCQYKLYPNMNHGWCAGRGDWTKPELRDTAYEVINLSKEFINKHHH